MGPWRKRRILQRKEKLPHLNRDDNIAESIPSEWRQVYEP